MRIRSTKPEFWHSETIGALCWDDRLVLKALESYCDDNGVGRDREVIFCASAFPHDVAQSPEIFAKVSRSLSRLADAGLIVRYTYDGEPLIYVRNWRRWQYIDKPKAGRYRRPDGSLHYRDDVDETIGAGQYVSAPAKLSVVRDSSPELPENCAKTSGGYPQIQSGEQGNRGTEEQGSRGTGLRVVPQTGGAKADANDPPTEFCSKHPNGTESPCRPCGNARKARERWDAEHAVDAGQTHARAKAQFWESVRACPDCDEKGYVPTDEGVARCGNHDWPQL